MEGVRFAEAEKIRLIRAQAKRRTCELLNDTTEIGEAHTDNDSRRAQRGCGGGGAVRRKAC